MSRIAGKHGYKFGFQFDPISGVITQQRTRGVISPGMDSIPATMDTTFVSVNLQDPTQVRNAGWPQIQQRHWAQQDHRFVWRPANRPARSVVLFLTFSFRLRFLAFVLAEARNYLLLLQISGIN